MGILRIVTGRMFTNTYIVYENGAAAIIDPGADFERIAATLERVNAKAECVIATHAHFDHIGEIAAFKRCGAKVYFPEKDYGILVENDFDIDLGFGENPVAPFSADVLLHDGDVFTAAGHEFGVVATPGHSAGSVCYIMDGKTLFSGDTLFKLSVGRFDFNYSDEADLMRSICRLLKIDGDLDVLPGHGSPTTLDFERKNNPYAKRS